MFFESLQTYKDFTVQKSTDCTPANETYDVRFTALKVTTVDDTMFFSGIIDILVKLPMNIELEIAITRCNLDGTGGSPFDKIIIPRMCETMNTNTSAAFKMINGIHPHPACPISAGTYVLNNESKFTFGFFRALPMEGYLWQTRTVFHEKKGRKRIRKLACLVYDVAVVNKVRRPRLKN